MLVISKDTCIYTRIIFFVNLTYNNFINLHYPNICHSLENSYADPDIDIEWFRRKNA